MAPPVPQTHEPVVLDNHGRKAVRARALAVHLAVERALPCRSREPSCPLCLELEAVLAALEKLNGKPSTFASFFVLNELSVLDAYVSHGDTVDVYERRHVLTRASGETRLHSCLRPPTRQTGTLAQYG